MSDVIFHILHCNLGNHPISKEASNFLKEAIETISPKIRVQFSPLNEDQVDIVRSYSLEKNNDLPYFLAKANILPEDTTLVRLLIQTDTGSPCADWVLSKCPHAVYGGSDGVISIDYSTPFSPANQLHEMLHLFGVADCYDEHAEHFPPLPTCSNNKCVMRYDSLYFELCENARSEIALYLGNILKDIHNG